MAGIITIRFDLIKNGVQSRAVPHPVFLPGEVAPHYGPSRYLTFEGFSVDENGKQHYMDATVAYRQACLRAIQYLKQFGYSGEQIYLLLSCAPVRGTIAGIVDIPNVCTTLGIPMDVFQFDISIEAEPVKRDLGAAEIMKFCAVTCAAAALAGVACAAAAQVADDMATLSKRRVADLAEFPDPTWFGNIQKWIDTQKEDGTWPDVNYLSGCTARRANWPIQEHWNRIITLASAWSGASVVADQKWANNTKAWDSISNGLDYWFKNDYEPADCMGNGGIDSSGCPCGTPGLWNTNWYGQAILIPQLSSTACLLAKDGNLSQEQREGCIRLTRRTYDNIDSSYGTGGVLTAANIVLVLQSAVSMGLFTDNSTVVESAIKRAFSVMIFTDGAGQDGIHRDGTFLQHDGILYNGNYGKDLLNIFIQLQGEAVGTQFAADDVTREAMSTYIRGDEWMIFTEQTTRQQHWDFNAIGRFVSYPTQDLQANADINFNVTKLSRAVSDFTGPYDRLHGTISEPPPSALFHFDATAS
ncbi:hypothetical protein NLG97_g10515 [Lecanicillium saksenae]|uniref:Uncharacterized protein n=1 Tax=Lecanicillium saksenae TaxID=468837 RepID=A0ACC1QEA9_9HYPO|nr:hypothetical protein NLG97_g10515 [Lecanicillium saksenae]